MGNKNDKRKSSSEEKSRSKDEGRQSQQPSPNPKRATAPPVISSSNPPKRDPDPPKPNPPKPNPPQPDTQKPTPPIPRAKPDPPKPNPEPPKPNPPQQDTQKPSPPSKPLPSVTDPSSPQEPKCSCGKQLSPCEKCTLPTCSDCTPKCKACQVLGLMDELKETKQGNDLEALFQTLDPDQLEAKYQQLLFEPHIKSDDRAQASINKQREYYFGPKTLRINDILAIYTKFKLFRRIYEEPECILKDTTEEELLKLHKRLKNLKKALDQIMKENSWTSHPLEDEMRLLDQCFSLLLQKKEDLEETDTRFLHFFLLMQMIKKMEARRDSEVQTCLMLNRCTFYKTKDLHHTQQFFRCITCNLVGDLGVCKSCAERCHKGHELSEPLTVNCYCDCKPDTCICRGEEPNVVKNGVPGSIVRRGPDWFWGDQDGPGGIGVVLGEEPGKEGKPPKVAVQWLHSGKAMVYRAKPGKYDLMYAQERVLSLK